MNLVYHAFFNNDLTDLKACSELRMTDTSYLLSIAKDCLILSSLGNSENTFRYLLSCTRYFQMQAGVKSCQL